MDIFKNWPKEVLAAVVTGIFGIATIAATSYFSGSASEAAKSANNSALVVGKKALAPVPVGTLISSMVEPEEFYRENNGSSEFDREESQWVLADGRIPIHGSRYHALTDENRPPNMSGHFLRGVDQTGTIDVDGTRSAGSIQQDSFQDHTFNADRLKVSGEVNQHSPTPYGQLGHGSSRNGDYESRELGSPQPVSQDDIVRVSKETRPKNVAVFFYLKIN